MSKKRRLATVFDEAVMALIAQGLFKGMEDADNGLNIIISKKHIKDGKKNDESKCVLALALAESQGDMLACSAGPSVTKILYGSHKVLRYKTSGKLSRAVKEFDKTGEWNLKPGIYSLLIPGSSEMLYKNLSDECRKRKANRFRKLTQKLKAGEETSGEGLTKHKGADVSMRQITIIRRTDG